MIDKIEKLRSQLRDRKESKFFGAKTGSALKTLDEKRSGILKQDFEVSFNISRFQFQFLGILLYCG